MTHENVTEDEQLIGPAAPLPVEFYPTFLRVAPVTPFEGVLQGESVASPRVLKSDYVLPSWVKAPEDRASTNPVGILALITEAKNAGNVWADTALAEVSKLSGTHYEFSRRACLEFERYEVKSRG